MCGIGGLVGLRGNAVDHSIAERMVASIAHRGPDGSGRFHRGAVALIHSRLSILDPTDAGAQPMRRGQNWLVHNGEIYNYHELAAELSGLGYGFESASDTEVILAAYLAWGTKAVERFNGMWAFALWDAQRSRLWLSRDRMGVKPLYVRTSGSTLAFASEIPALIAAGPLDAGDGWRPEPDVGAVRDFLVRGMVDHSVKTFFTGITALPAGHSLTVDLDGERLTRYWSPTGLSDDPTRPSRATETSDRRLTEEFVSLFDDSVRLRLRSDVPIGTCLSGGLDSSAIVSATAHALRHPAHGVKTNEQHPRYAFHARYPQHGVDESRYAELAASSAGISIVFKSVDMEPLVPHLRRVLSAQGEPFAGSSVFAQWTVMQAAHQRALKVLLDGQGADELLGGYLPYLGYRAAGLSRGGLLSSAANELRGSVSAGVVTPRAAVRGLLRGMVSYGLNERVRAATRGAFGVRVGPELAREPSLAAVHGYHGTPLARRLWQDASSEMLPALLRYEDRNSMAFGIESRVPFLDYRLVEFALTLPDRLRISDGVTKRILRMGMSGRVPEAIVDRRDKVGFATPQGPWLRVAAPAIAKLLIEGGVVQRGWVAKSEVRRLLAIRNGGDGSLLWRLLVLEIWLRCHFEDSEKSAIAGQ
jgi:asparagine synthase (glutamine-hydrolysing)